MIRTALAALLGTALIAGCGKTEPTAPPAATAAPATAPTPVAQGDLAQGEHVYKVTCAMCHAIGAGGAPLFKSKEEWGPRIAQGKDVLYGHALKGFTGGKGTMPAKGGNASLTDEDVKAGVDFMVSKGT